MSSTKFFRFPWAASGDKIDIPDTVPPSGAVSYPQGFGPDYERDPATDPLAKRVPRDETNQLYYDLTSNLRAWQVGALPEWVTAAQNGGTAVTYPVGSMVRHDQSGTFVNYVANVETDEEPGTGSDWSVVFGSPGIVPFQSVTDIRNDPPATPSLGDAYIVGDTPTGVWVGQENVIAYWNGSGWTFTSPTPWMLVGLADRTDRRWDPTLPAWTQWEATESVHGPVRLATAAEVEAGVDAEKVITPATLREAQIPNFRFFRNSVTLADNVEQTVFNFTGGSGLVLMPTSTWASNTLTIGAGEEGLWTLIVGSRDNAALAGAAYLETGVIINGSKFTAQGSGKTGDFSERMADVYMDSRTLSAGDEVQAFVRQRNVSGVSRDHYVRFVGYRVAN